MGYTDNGVSKSDMNMQHLAITNSRQYDLPTHGIGHSVQLVNFTITQIDVDLYRIEPRQGGPSPSAYTTDGYTTSMIINGMIPIGYDLRQHASISHKEQEELDTLKRSLSKWKHQEKLKRFQELPSHIRQEIVDEALLRDCVRDIHDEASIDEKQFPDYDRLIELKLKNQEKNDRCVDSNRFTGSSKYQAIISVFKTEELVEAHAQASLEDEIAE